MTYIGIDLGTTNSVICSYDGENTRIWKSPEQNDITPSAIFINKRGGKVYGQVAYNNSPRDPNNSASLFKRLMGTSTKIKIEHDNLSMTPEQCSSEILKVLFGYLPEDVRGRGETATVITVPASFNQMQKDSTLEAAELAGIGMVSLMQEPVAAIMSVTRNAPKNGTFVVYDLGGGTFDVSIAESIGNRVNLLAHGGIAMCGGRDFDRIIFDNVVLPWLTKNFDIPSDFRNLEKYKVLARLAMWALERAKIELSAREETQIRLDEVEARTVDNAGNDIYLDIPLSRRMVDSFISEKIGETIQSTRDMLDTAGVKPEDVEKIVFIGGPTNYKPLRDKVAFELGIAANMNINPMTAVAEGAAVFAESIDWSTLSRTRKPTQGEVKSAGGLVSFKFIARTSDDKAKIAAILSDDASELTYQINNTDTGWTTGKKPLIHEHPIELSLTKPGANAFEVKVYDKNGNELKLSESRIVITKTAMNIGTIPASHSIGLEILDKIGGTPVLDYIVKEGDSLPKKYEAVYKATQTLEAGCADDIKFKLWEGEITNPIDYNRYIGTFKITGNDFETGSIAAGSDLVCAFEMNDSGNISIEVSIPSLGTVFRSKNFYSRQEGQIDFDKDLDTIIVDAEKVVKRIDAISEKVSDPMLDKARKKVKKALALNVDVKDIENVQEASESVLEAKRITAHVIKEHIRDIRHMDLDSYVQLFNKVVKVHAKPSEQKAFNSLAETAQRAIDNSDNAFENHLDTLKQIIFDVLWRQDWFVIDHFKNQTASHTSYGNYDEFMKLKKAGQKFVEKGDIPSLRDVIAKLYNIKIVQNAFDNMIETVNITKG